MVDMLYKYKAADPASLEYTESDVQKAFQTGTYALTYNWEGDLPADNDPTQAKHKDAAWKLLAYMASPAWQKKSAIIAGDYPVLTSLYSDPELQQKVQD